MDDDAPSLGRRVIHRHAYTHTPSTPAEKMGRDDDDADGTIALTHARVGDDVRDETVVTMIMTMIMTTDGLMDDHRDKGVVDDDDDDG